MSNIHAYRHLNQLYFNQIFSVMFPFNFCCVCRTEIFSGKTVTHDDISYEQACILYNLGELSHIEQFMVLFLNWKTLIKAVKLIYLCRIAVKRLSD